MFLIDVTKRLSNNTIYISSNTKASFSDLKKKERMCFTFISAVFPEHEISLGRIHVKH